MQPYRERRDRLAKMLEGAVAIFPSAHERLRSNDTEYDFRQNSDFYYLTGFDEPDAVLVVAPQHPTERTIVFVRPCDRAQEIWTGRRLGVEAASQRLGVDAAYSIEDFDKRLPDYLGRSAKLYFTLGENDAFDRRVHAALEEARRRTRRVGRAPRSIVDCGVLVHEMRLFKSAHEIEIMRRAAAISAAGHRAAMTGTRPGLYEYEIEALLEYEYRRAGGCEAYPSIVGAGDNAVILHYNTNRDRLQDGDLLLVDSGAEFGLYTSDVTRTWPVNGRFSAEQRAIYEIVLAAQEAAIAQVRPGVACNAFGETAARVITEGLIELGLLTGSLDENVEQKKYRDYYMHGAGHWIGLDVHDVGRYRDEETDEYRLLEPGMVTTVEPGIYVHRDLDCDERFKGIGVRIEDDILLTPTGNENLNAEIPKQIAEIEALIGSAACV